MSPSPAPENLGQWRKVMRAELLARRTAVAEATRRDWDLAVSLILLRALPVREGLVLAFCWPHRGEYDARPLLHQLRERGVRCALPVVLRAAEPLIFRQWEPATPMSKGPLGIPFPTDSEQVHPDVALVPMVGFGRGYRLGYGGGYFDRTLASSEPRPLSIGIAYEICQIDTIFPQPHDIPMDAIVTERCARWTEGGMSIETPAILLKERLQDLAQVRSQLARLNAHTVPHSLT